MDFPDLEALLDCLGRLASLERKDLPGQRYITFNWLIQNNAFNMRMCLFRAMKDRRVLQGLPECQEIKVNKAYLSVLIWK